MLFSIVIPTRNRPEYLPAAVRSALQQADAGEYEVIVFDNASTTPASVTLGSLEGCDNLRIVRVEEALPMRDSWETSLALANGGFVTILGDDDALLPHAVKVGRELALAHDVEVIRWDRAHYIWPGNIDEATNNICKIPLGRTAYKMDGRKTLKEIGRAHFTYSVTPMIYNSWVKVELIQAIKRKAGRIFHSTFPDVDSGIAIAYSARWYLSLNFPLGICAQSPKSNGAQAHAFNRQQADGSAGLEVINDFNRLNKIARLTKSDNHVVTLWESIADSYKTMAEKLQIPESVFKLDERQIVRRIFAEELPKMPLEKKHLYLERISSDGQPLRFTPEEIKVVADSLKNTELLKDRPPNQGFDPFEQYLTIDCAPLGINDPAELALLMDKLLGLKMITRSILIDIQPKSWMKKARDAAYRMIKLKDTDLTISKFRKSSV